LKKNLLIASICLFCTVLQAEYKELEALKESGREAMAQYAKRFAAVDPKFEGIIKFAEAIKAINKGSKVDNAKSTSIQA